MKDAFGHETYLDIFQVAEQQNIDVGVVHDWIRDGLPHNQLSGHIEVAAADLRAFLDSHRTREMPTVEATDEDPTKQPMTLHAMADHHDIKVRHVESWISEGLPHTTRDGKRYVTRDDVYEFVREKNALLDDEPPRTTQSSGIAGEATGTESVIIAETFNHGFFG